MKTNICTPAVSFWQLLYHYANIKIDSLILLQSRLIPVRNSRRKKLNTMLQCTVPIYIAHNEIWIIYFGA